MVKKMAVLGAGAWGITLANMLSAREEFDVFIWSRNPSVAEEIKGGQAAALAGVSLHKGIRVSTGAAEVLDGADVVASAVVSFGLRDFLKAAGSFWPRKAMVVNACKGLEETSGKRMSQIFFEELPWLEARQLAVLSGPNLALEIALGKPASTVIASQNIETAEFFQSIFHSDSFRAYASSDVAGVEFGGAIKNVIAIAAGICHGLELGDNCVAALATRGIREISRLGAKFGAMPETFAGLAGFGDILVTCVSPQSRNRSLGEAIGRGASPEKVLAERKSVEGIHTVKALKRLSMEHNTHLPISEIVNRVLFEGFPAKEAGAVLMERVPQHEIN
jgi:glycerol-3-phosphate dehydrogenase (NAD(P)+)